jgi:hypothetical protein
VHREDVIGIGKSRPTDRRQAHNPKEQLQLNPQRHPLHPIPYHPKRAHRVAGIVMDAVGAKATNKAQPLL